MNPTQIANDFADNLVARATADQSACGDFCRQFVYVRKTPKGLVRYHLGLHAKAVSRVEFVAALAQWKVDSLAAEAKYNATVECKVEVNYVAGSAPLVSLKGQRLLHLEGTYRYFHVGAVPHGHSARKEFQGPLVDGPWAFAFEGATVISASQEHRDADRAGREAALVVKHGSRIWVDAVEYIVEVKRGEYINLVSVK